MTDLEKGVKQAPQGPAWARAGSKPKSLTGALRSLFGYMGDERRLVWIATVCAVIGTVLSLIGPQVLDAVTDEISGSILDGTDMDLDGIGRMCIALTVLYAVAFILTYLETYWASCASQRVGDRMRRDLSRKFHRLPFGYLEGHSIGDTMSRVTNDTDTVRKESAEAIVNLIDAFVVLIGSLVMMMYTSWQLCILAILPTFLGVGIIYTVTHTTQRYFVAQQADLGKINTIVEEAYYGHDIVRTYNGWDQIGRRFDEVNRDLFDSAYKAKMATTVPPQVMQLIGNLGYVVVCIAGAYMIIDGTITFGVIAAFIIYIKMFNQPVTQMSNVAARMQSVASASERVFDFLSLAEMEPDPAAAGFTRAVGKVEFRDVRFSYIPGREVIHGLDLTVMPGSTIAIVGPTGAGKSTLMNLLMRFYEPDSGEILIDGVPIRSMSRAQVREQFSMVLQDTFIFDGTVFENVAYTTAGATMERVEEACRTVGIDAYIRGLPDGYDTMLTGGGSLSVGQRQQIAIARAIVKDAPMIILDEATSSVDTRTEKRIQKAMDSMTSGRTSFVIAHRLSTVRNADRILVMVGGEIVESGTHEELLELNGVYRSLHDAQFEESD